jgi:hypothetical protein
MPTHAAHEVAHGANHAAQGISRPSRFAARAAIRRNKMATRSIMHQRENAWRAIRHDIDQIRPTFDHTTKDISFPPTLSFDPRVRWTTSASHRRTSHPRSRFSRFSGGYQLNASRGYYYNDNVNSYSHRRYHRTHRYQPQIVVPPAEVPVTLSYESLRATMPPDSPNFCFIPLSQLGTYGTSQEAKAAETFDVRSKLYALFYRPTQTSTGVCPNLAQEINSLVASTTARIAEIRHPDSVGPWIGNCCCIWCCGCGLLCAYNCVFGGQFGSVNDRKRLFVESEYNSAMDDILGLWNSNTTVSNRGIAVTLTDIGDIMSGLVFEVLPYMLPSYQEPIRAAAPQANPHFLLPPLLAPLDLTPNEASSITMIEKV